MVLLLGALGCAGTTVDGPAITPASPATLVVVNANVITLNPIRPRAEAFAVRSGRFHVIGSDAQVRPFIGAETRVYDAGGWTIVPGLIDAHLHLFGEGYRLMGLDLVGTRSRKEVLERVAAAARTALPGVWLRGRGWDQNDWEDKRFPTAAELDAVVDDRPLILSRIDGHAIWVNSRALEVAGIDRATPDPEGGRIERTADGLPSGVLIDNAERLVLRHVPAYTRQEKYHAAKLAAQECVAAGLTGIHEPGLGEEEIAVLKELYRREEMPLRIYAMLSPGPALEHYLEAGPEVGLFGHRLTVRAVKLYADGALGSRGAALLADYTDDPGNRGLLTTASDELEQQVRRIALGGLQPCVHAIGDRANRMVLDVFESVGGITPLRPRIEHAQIVDPSDLERFASLGVIASMQPTHATSDMPWVGDRLGDARLAGAYAWNTMLRGGAHLAFGSDAPVESVEPRFGLYAAMTRMDHDQEPPGGWQVQEAVDFETALRAFALGAAYAAHEERLKGSIEPGKLADFVVFDGDLSTATGPKLLRIAVRATFVAGEAVYEAGAPR